MALASDANKPTKDEPVMAVDIIPPSNYKAAMKSDLAEESAEAIRKELQGTIDLGACEVVPRCRSDTSHAADEPLSLLLDRYRCPRAPLCHLPQPRSIYSTHTDPH